MAGYTIEERLDWGEWVTPKPLSKKPIHRWYVFPHSFTSELVHGLAVDWRLGPNDLVLDPFAGAGTTLLAAKQMGLSANGYDLSPLSVLVTGAKIAKYDVNELEDAWADLREKIEADRWKCAARQYPPLILKALPGPLLNAFENIDRSIAELPTPVAVRNFFRLALLRLIPKFSRAVATGGWLSWVDSNRCATDLLPALNERVALMMEDVRQAVFPPDGVWNVTMADARSIPDADNRYAAVITSPPYPNRHDYTRVFGVELMFAFLDWNSTRDLRYQSFHSHPEARPKRNEAEGYTQPGRLVEVLQSIREIGKDHRVSNMIEGYFLDTFLSLREIKRLCREGARIAWVVGNAQYYGLALPVDEITAEIGKQVGLICDRLLVARYRGNSAQQMSKYGRNPSRESVVILRA